MSNTDARPGNLYVICAPSGTGKTTLVKALVESTSNITVSISHTTREKRSAEIHGVDYYFISKTDFHRMIEHNDFLEYATVFENLYGTSRSWVAQTLTKGMDVILEIDWQGCQQIQRLFPDCISIFILPPSLSALSQRLLNRNQDSAEIIKQRLADVRESTSHVDEFNYVIMNDDFTTAINDLKTIIQAGYLLQKNQIKKYAKLLNELNNLVSLEQNR